MNAMSTHNDENWALPGTFVRALQRHSDRLPPKLQECISDLATLDEATMSLRYFRPSIGCPMTDATVPSIASEHKHRKVARNAIHVDNNMYKYHPILFDRLQQFLRCPMVEARVAARSISHFDKAHDTLGRVWADYRKARMELLKQKQCPQELIADAMESVQYGLTQEYKHSREEDRTQLQVAISEKGQSLSVHSQIIANFISREYCRKAEAFINAEEACYSTEHVLEHTGPNCLGF